MHPTYPLCSCRRTISDRPDARALDTRFCKTRFPLFNRILVGNNNLISFANVPSLLLGSRLVVTRILGSTTPLNCPYSSSSPSSSSTVLSARVSSYLKSFFKFSSFAMAGSRGFPEARLALSAARLEASSASRRVSALLYGL